MYPNGGVGQSGAPVVFSGLSFARGLGMLQRNRAHVLTIVEGL